MKAEAIPTSNRQTETMMHRTAKGQRKFPSVDSTAPGRFDRSSSYQAMREFCHREGRFAC